MSRGVRGTPGRAAYVLWLKYQLEFGLYEMPSAEELADHIMGTSDWRRTPDGEPPKLMQRRPVKKQITQRRIDDADGLYDLFSAAALPWLDARDANGHRPEEI